MTAPFAELKLCATVKPCATVRRGNLIARVSGHAYTGGMRKRVLMLLIVVLPMGLAAKKRAPAMYVNPNQLVEIADAARIFAVADKPCGNYAWAAAVNTLLAVDGVRLPQSHWVVRASGGDKCLTRVEDPAGMTQQIEGDYTLDSGRRIKLRSQFHAGPPNTIDDLVVLLRNGRPSIILFSGRVLLLQGILYDDHMRSYNDHFFIVKELRLIDPALAPSAPGRTVTFLRDKDDANLAEIEGVITLTVRDLKVGELSEGYQK